MTQAFEQFPLQLEDRFKEAFALFAKSPEVYITIAFAMFGASLLLNTIPVLGQLAQLLLLALGPAAFYLAAQEGARTGTATFDSLRPLTTLFPQLLALAVVKYILIALGFCFLLIPGVYLAVLLSFAELFVVLEGKTFLEALRASHALVRGNWFRVFGLCFVLGLIAFSGVLLIGLGLLLTVPFAFLVMFCVYRRATRVQVVG